MAYSFNFKSVATLKAKSATSTDMFTFQGVTTANTTPANAAAQVNKLLSIVDKAVVADNNMTRTIVEESVDDE